MAALTVTGPTPEDVEAILSVSKVKVAFQVDEHTVRIVHVLDWFQLSRAAFAADMRDALAWIPIGPSGPNIWQRLESGLSGFPGKLV